MFIGLIIAELILRFQCPEEILRNLFLRINNLILFCRINFFCVLGANLQSKFCIDWFP